MNPKDLIIGVIIGVGAAIWLRLLIKSNRENKHYSHSLLSYDIKIVFSLVVIIIIGLLLILRGVGIHVI